MKIIVLGGSPKGGKSVTMQYVEYLRRRYPEVIFDVRQPAYRIRHLEKNLNEFEELMNGVAEADGVLWAFPLYYMAACSDYMRFIELIDERSAQRFFAGKPAAAITSSIHFFDNIAMDYIRAVSEDLKMGFVDLHPAEMDDLTRKTGRDALEGFFENFCEGIRNGVPFSREFPERRLPAGNMEVRIPESPISTKTEPLPENSDTRWKITVISDYDDGILGGMVNHLSRTFEGQADVSVVSLRRVNMAGGCKGCLQCGWKNRCRYDGADDLRDVYTRFILPADAVIFASEIKGRWYSSRMKAFVDRGFFKTHQPVFVGKQVAVLLEGDISTNPTLKEGLGAYVECMGGSLTGIVASGSDSGQMIAERLDSLARRTLMALDRGYRRPNTFLGVGGGKVFRDDIYNHLGIVFRGDHLYYRKNGMYRTFPHARPLRLVFYRIVGAIAALPPVRRKMVENMKDFMLMPYQKALEIATVAAIVNPGPEQAGCTRKPKEKRKPGSAA